MNTSAKKMSTSSLMLLALVVGVITGLFFGERAGWLGDVGQAVILLMQMTVLPYILVSLIGGIGRLQKSHAQLLFVRAGIIMLSLWLLGMVIIFLMPLSFPSIESASFFSTSSITESDPINYFKLYIPANPFESMSSGAVPAMVIFSIALGAALIGIEEKDQLLAVMSTVSKALSKVTATMIRILPIGVFAMSASAAGTLSIEEFASLQVYLISYFIVCLLLAFWILPQLIATLTPVKYKEVIELSRTALITAFATGNVFILLPVIIEECKKIMAKHNELDDDSANMIDILIPIAFSFPNLGKVTVILFVLFSGWFTGRPIEFIDMPSLGIGGLLSLFGSVYIAIPFMLDSMQLPADLAQLFIMSGFITGKFSSMVAVMTLITLALLAICVFRQALRLKLRHWLRLGITLTATMFITIALTRTGMELFIDQEAKTDDVIANMHISNELLRAADKKVFRKAPALGTPRPLANLKTIQERGVLRVGYTPSNVPFSYFNNSAELVGFDVEMAHKLASDLAVSLEFIPYQHSDLQHNLDTGLFDVAMSGLAMDTENSQKLSFSHTVMELNYSLVTRDYRVKNFDSVAEIKQHEPFTVAYIEHDAGVKKTAMRNPNITFVAIDKYHQFFKQKDNRYDALLCSAQAGFAWSLFFPDYGVAIFDKQAKYPVAYATAWDNSELTRYLNSWLQLQQTNGSRDKLYQYWIMGQGASDSGPRWSIMSDLLGWGEQTQI